MSIVAAVSTTFMGYVNRIVNMHREELKKSGSRVKGCLLVASAPGQMLCYFQAFLTKASKAWGEFHERAFHFLEALSLD